MLAQEHAAVSEKRGDGQSWHSSTGRLVRVPLAPTSRQIARKRQSMATAARPQSLADAPLPTAMVPATGDAGPGLTTALNLGEDLRALRSTARRKATHQKMVERSELVIQQQRLASYGPAILEGIYSAFPDLVTLAPSFHLLARSPHPIIEMCPSGVELATHAACWALDNKRTSNLHQALSVDWERLGEATRAGLLRAEPPCLVRWVVEAWHLHPH